MSIIASNIFATGSNLATLLAVWSVIGFLTLSDLGLMRTASQRVSSGEPARHVVPDLARVAVASGGAVSIGLVGFLVLSGPALSYRPFAIALLALLPPVMLAQFPIVGALEASGQFGVVAANKSLSAVATYGIPAVALLLGDVGLIAGLGVIVGYRLIALVWTFGALPRGEHQSNTRPNSSYFGWIAASSVIGPAFLYADRLFIALGPGAREIWIYYTTTSEMLLRSYIVPTSIIAAIFPWTVRALSHGVNEVRRAYSRILPSITLVACTILVLAALAIPDRYFDWFGITGADLWGARTATGALLVGTALSWSSQAQIAMIQAAGGHREIVLGQLAMLPPFLIALWLSAPYGVVAVGLVWLLRVSANWIYLMLLVKARLRVNFQSDATK
ncbi:MATE family efflux transporter [Calidifontibacter terrae]